MLSVLIRIALLRQFYGYTQHTIIVQKFKKIYLNYCHLLPYDIEQISIVPKMFEPLKFVYSILIVHIIAVLKPYKGLV